MSSHMKTTMYGKLHQNLRCAVHLLAEGCVTLADSGGGGGGWGVEGWGVGGGGGGGCNPPFQTRNE